MCFLPKLQTIKTKTDVIAEFKGLNQRPVIEDGELADCYGVSLENHPALNVRDGYEVYIAPSLPNEKIRAKSVRGNMVVHVMAHYTLSFIDKITGNTRTETLPLYFGENNIGMDLYNGDLFFLSAPDSDGNFTLSSYKFEYTVIPTSSVEVYNIFDSNIFKEYDENIPTCFMGFGDRMLIAYKTEVAVSYRNNIGDWNTMEIEGTPTEECAWRYNLPDDGYFTGCANYRDYPILFKENSMYTLLGEYAPFSLSRIDMVGCPYPDTIAVCNGALYFLAQSGVMEYTGGVPRLISQDIKLPFTSSLTGHTACADDRYYYIANLAFDTYTRTWAKTFEDSPEIIPNTLCFTYEYFPQCYFDGQTYFKLATHTHDPGGTQVTMNGLKRSSSEAAVNWSFTTKRFHEYQEGKKILSRIAIGIENISLSALRIQLSLDNGEFQTVYTWDTGDGFANEIPLILPPCEYFQIKVSGTGKANIHYIKRRYRVLGR